MRIAGIDPGLDGAIAVVYAGGSRFAAFPFPKVKAKGRGYDLHWAAMPDDIERICFEVDHAFVEKVGVRPNQGASGGFKFGTCYGAARMALTMLRIPVTPVTPSSWKTALHLGHNKERAIARASELFPKDIDQLKVSRGERTKKQVEGIAEAALIGYYGYRLLEAKND